jgi:hypothetical protein
MSQIPSENDDDRSVAASDFVQLGRPNEVPDVEAKMMEKLKDEFAKVLSTQNEQHQQEKAQLEVTF